MPTVDVSPTANGDDGRRESNGNFDAGNNPTTGNGFGLDRFGWWRFPSVTVPNGATIDVAYVTLTVLGGSGAGTINTNVYAIDEDDHAAPTTNAEWVTDHAAHTTAFATWDFTKSNINVVLQTSSLVSVIQEIVDRAGWSSGNAIGIHIDPDSPTAGIYQDFDAVETSPGDEAVLHIEYTAAAAAGVSHNNNLRRTARGGQLLRSGTDM